MPKLLVSQDFLDRQTKDRVHNMQRVAEAIRGAASHAAAPRANTGVKEEEQEAPDTGAPKVPLPVSEFTDQIRQRQAEHRKQRDQEHQKLLASEGRLQVADASEDQAGTTNKPLDTSGAPAQPNARPATEGPSGAASSAAPAASSAGTRRTALVLTPAKDCRNNHSLPHNFKAKRAKITKDNNEDTSDNDYEVSLGTELDDFPEDDPDNLMTSS